MLTCPHCGHTQQETMPTDACHFFYECSQCKALLRPRAIQHPAHINDISQFD
ncbi:GDCCVxC domain-containing (seleno)protein [Pseudomonas kielensis]|uniref:GDCCVxC domain-containing (seleno)protein n=1 Tax=Pseudomonas TaxID=286 RepID=UPI003CC7EF98